jgi:hypothetical protein
MPSPSVETNDRHEIGLAWSLTVAKIDRPFQEGIKQSGVAKGKIGLERTLDRWRARHWLRTRGLQATWPIAQAANGSANQDAELFLRVSTAGREAGEVLFLSPCRQCFSRTRLKSIKTSCSK